jgi:hypothetical protein
MEKDGAIVGGKAQGKYEALEKIFFFTQKDKQTEISAAMHLARLFLDTPPPIPSPLFFLLLPLS